MNRAPLLLGCLLLVAAPAAAQIQPGDVIGHRAIANGTSGFPDVLQHLDHFGKSAAHVGDVDGNGTTDLLVGAPEQLDAFGDNAGRVWLLLLDPDGTVRGTTELSAATLGLLYGGQPVEWHDFGWAVAAMPTPSAGADVSLLVSDINLQVDGGPIVSSGGVWRLDLTADGQLLGKSALAPGVGGYPGGASSTPVIFGRAVAALGDLDGNGANDIAIGQSESITSGRVTILFLDTDGSILGEQPIGEGLGGFSEDLEGANRFGAAIASLGTSERWVGHRVVVGEPAGHFPHGRIFVLDLDTDGTVLNEQVIGRDEIGLDGILVIQEFGTSVSAAGDINGDGITDIAVGAPGSGGSVIDTGALFLLYLDADGTLLDKVTIGGQSEANPIPIDPEDRFGSSVALLEEDTGNGIVRLAIGAEGRAEPGTFYPDSGLVWIADVHAGGAIASWTDLGGALAGTQGEPELVGSGAMIEDVKFELSLSKAKHSATAFLVVGLSAIELPFKGGVMVPAIDVVKDYALNEIGMKTIKPVWPGGVPAGQSVYFQYWIPDSAAVQGYAASNAVVAVVP